MYNRVAELRVRLCAIAIAVGLLLAHAAGAAAPTDLLIRATAASFRVGTNGLYTVTVSNVGGAATDATIHVTDTLPAGLSLASGIGANWHCTAAGQSVDCANDVPLAAGSTSSLRLIVSVCTAAFPGVINGLTVDYPADTNPRNNTTRRTTRVKAGRCIPHTATPQPSPGTPLSTPTRTLAPTARPTPTPIPAVTDLLLTKTGGSTFRVGSQGLYTLTVRNLGPASTTNAFTVFDTLPVGLNFVAGTGSGWTCSAAGQNVTCTNASPLAVGTSTSIALTVDVTSAAYPSVTNSATVLYPGDANAGNNTARRPTTIRQ